MAPKKMCFWAVMGIPSNFQQWGPHTKWAVSQSRNRVWIPCLAARCLLSISSGSETPWSSCVDLIQIMDLEMSRTLGWPQLTPPAQRSAALASVNGSKGLKLQMNLEYNQHFAGDFGTCLVSNNNFNLYGEAPAFHHVNDGVQQSEFDRLQRC